MNACLVYLGGFETLGGCEGLYGGGRCLAMYSEESLKCVEQLGGAVLGK